jgi:hypothetical protein
MDVVPRIAPNFDGYALFINHNDHPPPHFHVRGKGHQCRFYIESGLPMDASPDMPSTTKTTMKKWTDGHRNELFVSWRHAMDHKSLKAIAGPS